jgi:hypothetical protein
MAGLRKDVELIFRGEDRASPSIKAVRKSVTDLTGAINEQLSAADRGEGSIDDLAKSYRGLKAAQGDINEIVKLATAYERQTPPGRAERQSRPRPRPSSKQLNAKIAAAERRPSGCKMLATRPIDRLPASSRKKQQLQVAVRETGAALDAAGGDSKNFANTQDLIRTAAIETARALRDAAAAMDQFKGKQATGKGNVAARPRWSNSTSSRPARDCPRRKSPSSRRWKTSCKRSRPRSRRSGEHGRLNAELEANGIKAPLRQRERLKAGSRRSRRGPRTPGRYSRLPADGAGDRAGARDISRFGSQMDTTRRERTALCRHDPSILSPTQAAAARSKGWTAFSRRPRRH